jgi:hypothetical protein
MPLLTANLENEGNTTEARKLKQDSKFVNRFLGYIFTDMLKFLPADDP